MMLIEGHFKLADHNDHNADLCTSAHLIL